MAFSGRVIGVDESGKGDFFGPLVIGSVLADEAGVEQLEGSGVRDSKTLSDKRISELDQAIRDRFVHAIVLIGPEKYNELYARIRNLNKLLAWGHAQAIENITKEHRADRAISDKFGKPELIELAVGRKGIEVEITQIVRGEKIIQVAAASIVARAAFVRRMRQLSKEYGMELPLGAGSGVDSAGRRLVQKFGVDVLEKVAKTHFKNYQRVATFI